MAGGYNPEHYPALFAVEDRHFWFRARNTVIELMVRREIAALPGGYRVLEVGCGTGYVLRMLKQVCTNGLVLGIDLHLEGLRMAKSRSDAHLLQASIERPPFAAGFDLVGMFDTLEHIDDDRAALQNVRTLIKPGGALLLTVPAWPALWSNFDEESHHCRRYEPQQLSLRLNEAGFAIDYLTPFMATLYPLARLGRYWSDLRRSKRSRRGQPTTLAVQEQLRIVFGNEFLSWALSQEARLLAGRRRLPTGTSLLAVARAC